MNLPFRNGHNYKSGCNIGEKKDVGYRAFGTGGVDNGKHFNTKKREGKGNQVFNFECHLPSFGLPTGGYFGI